MTGLGLAIGIAVATLLVVFGIAWVVSTTVAYDEFDRACTFAGGYPVRSSLGLLCVDLDALIELSP